MLLSAPISEAISDDSVRVSLDLVVIDFALLDATQVPGDHKGTRARDDGTLLRLARGEAGGGEGDGAGHVGDVLGFELQAKGDGLVLSHRLGEAKGIRPGYLGGDEQEVCFAGGDDVSAGFCAINPNDRITKHGEQRLGPFVDLVEEPDLPLRTGHGKFPRARRRAA